MSSIEVEGLSKVYGRGRVEVEAVRDLTFSVSEGEVFAMLGPNGAGKSTILMTLVTLLRPTAGRAVVAGFDVVEQPARVREVIGVALQEVGVNPASTVRKLLVLHARLHGFKRAAAMRRASEVLELVGLDGSASKKVATLSGGMRRRLDLALALVHRPPVVFLDEPTVGLDPSSRWELWREVVRLREAGTTIFLTTQNLEEADHLADTIAILGRGAVVAQGPPASLRRGIASDVVEMTFASSPLAYTVAGHLGPSAFVLGARVRCAVDAPTEVPRLLERLHGQGIYPDTVAVTKPTLDDVFAGLSEARP